jgi:uncharacterized protein GlcG (DUF336 family)
MEVPVTLSDARSILEAIEGRAGEQGVSICAAVVDEGGNPVATMRMDGAQIGAYQLALDKAWTAAAFQAPTDEWAEGTVPGRPGWGFSTSLGGRVIVFAGGLPIERDGRVIAGVGVSGSSPEVDAACAAAGVAATNGRP